MKRSFLEKKEKKKKIRLGYVKKGFWQKNKAFKM